MIIQNVEYLWRKGYWNTITTHCDQEVPHLALLGPNRVHLLLQAHLHLPNQRRVLLLLLTNQRPVFTWSRTLSPARRPSRAIRHAVVTRSGRWVCSMLACSWYLRQQAAVSSW